MRSKETRRQMKEEEMEFTDTDLLDGELVVDIETDEDMEEPISLQTYTDEDGVTYTLKDIITDVEGNMSVEDVNYVFETSEGDTITVKLDLDDTGIDVCTFMDEEGAKFMLTPSIDVDEAMPEDVEDILDMMDIDSLEDEEDIENLEEDGTTDTYFDPFTKQVKVVIDPTEIYNSKTLTEEDVLKSAADLALSLDPTSLDNGQKLLYSAVLSWLDNSANKLVDTLETDAEPKEPTEGEEGEDSTEEEGQQEFEVPNGMPDRPDLPDEEEEEVRKDIGVMESLEFKRVKPSKQDRAMWLESRKPFIRKAIVESHKRGILKPFIDILNKKQK